MLGSSVGRAVSLERPIDQQDVRYCWRWNIKQFIIRTEAWVGNHDATSVGSGSEIWNRIHDSPPLIAEFALRAATKLGWTFGFAIQEHHIESLVSVD